jgi:acetoin utilization protein AcuC
MNLSRSCQSFNHENSTAVSMPLFIGSEIYRATAFQPPHPLAVLRAPLVEDLCRAMGWLPEARYLASPQADRAALARFHSKDYLDALSRAEAEQALPEALRLKYRIGADSNVIHPAVYRRPAISAGGAILAAKLTRDGGTVHAPGAGNHHGRPDRASGFCFVNDAVLGIMEWLDQGLQRIAYLDLDAHHGDGVEAAFADDPRVLTISLHEAGRWPRTGTGSVPANSIHNFPVPSGFNDSELNYLMDRAILPLMRDHRPEAVMVLPGADALEEDPMARLGLSNRGLREAVALAAGLAPRLIVLGGGGYNPYALARAWSGIWAGLNGFAIPDILPEPALDVLASIRYFRAAGRNPPRHWLTSIADPPRHGEIRGEVRRLTDAAMEERAGPCEI